MKATKDAVAAEQVRAAIDHHSKSFALASKLLPEQSRYDAQVLYAWCRRADDAVDEPDGGLAGQRERLAGLRLELAAMYNGTAGDGPLVRACSEVIRRRAIPRAYFDALLDGMEMDVQGVDYPDCEQLLRYCYRVAGTVGLMMCHVLGVRRPEAVVHGAHLGIAMQLTNIARDVAEDWERGRLYLPDGLLRRHGVGGLRAALGSPFPRAAMVGVARATAELLDCAAAYYASGDQGLVDLPLRSGFGVYTARKVYSEIGARVRAQGCNPLAGRAHVPTARKLWLVGEALVGTVGALPVALFGARPAPPQRSVEDPATLLRHARVQEWPTQEVA